MLPTLRLRDNIIQAIVVLFGTFLGAAHRLFLSNHDTRAPWHSALPSDDCFRPAHRLRPDHPRLAPRPRPPLISLPIRR
jgi:hypothetical protein